MSQCTIPNRPDRPGYLGHYRGCGVVVPRCGAEPVAGTMMTDGQRLRLDLRTAELLPEFDTVVVAKEGTPPAPICFRRVVDLGPLTVYGLGIDSPESLVREVAHRMLRICHSRQIGVGDQEVALS